MNDISSTCSLIKDEVCKVLHQTSLYLAVSVLCCLYWVVKHVSFYSMLTWVNSSKMDLFLFLSFFFQFY